MGLEYDYLSQKMESLKAYRTGWELAKAHLGESHQLTVSLKKSCLADTDHVQSLESVVRRRKMTSRNSTSPRNDAYTPRKRTARKIPRSVPAKKSLETLPRINTTWSKSTSKTVSKPIYFKENSFESEMSKYWNFEPELQMRPTFTAPLQKPRITPPPVLPETSSASFRKRRYEALSLIENELRSDFEDSVSSTPFTKSSSSSVEYKKPSIGVQADLNKQ